MTAVTRPAEARRRASRMMNSSIRFSFTGWQGGWMTNTSWPRIEPSIFTSCSPPAERAPRRPDFRGDVVGRREVGVPGDQPKSTPGRRFLAGVLDGGGHPADHAF